MLFHQGQKYTIKNFIGGISRGKAYAPFAPASKFAYQFSYVFTLGINSIIFVIKIKCFMKLLLWFRPTGGFNDGYGNGGYHYGKIHFLVSFV